MLAILTTVFCFQCNNLETFLTCALSHYLTKVKYHLDANCRYQISNSLRFQHLLTIHVGSKKLKLYDTFRAECSPNMNFWEYFVFVLSYDSPDATHQCFPGEKR